MEQKDWRVRYRKQMQEVMEFSRLAYQKNLVSAAGGNVSARCGNWVAITASNTALRSVTESDLALTDLEGTVLDVKEGGKASKETPFHIHVYRQRPDVNFVMHLHPCYSILWSLTGKTLPLLTESARLKLTEVPIIRDEKPGSRELAEVVCQALKETPDTVNAFILKNHGILVMGSTMEMCFERAELLEDTAKIAVLHSILTK